MRDWFAALAVGLVIIVGCAAGLGGTLAFLLAFGIAWYLFAARDLGFARARDTLGIKLLPPIWRRGNWLWIETLFDDSERLLMATTVALIVTAAALMFWPDIVYGVALLIVAFYVSEILRGNAGPRPRRIRIPDGSRPTTGTTEATRSAITPMLTSPQRSTPTAAIDIAVRGTTKLSPPATAGLPGGRMIAEPFRRDGKRRLPRQRRKTPPKAGAQRSVPAMRAQLGKAKPAQRTKPTLPSRKPDYPIAIRPRKPLPQRPPLRKRTMRKPLPQLGRGTPKAAAAVKR